MPQHQQLPVEAGVLTNAQGKASCREDSLRSVWWARLWCILTSKGASGLSQFRSGERKVSNVARQGSKRQKQPCWKTAEENGREMSVRSWGPEQAMGQITDRQLLGRCNDKCGVAHGPGGRIKIAPM